MKQKRSKAQLNELGNKIANQSSTRPGGDSDRNDKRSQKNEECVSGICTVTWKPALLKP